LSRLVEMEVMYEYPPHLFLWYIIPGFTKLDSGIPRIINTKAPTEIRWQ
jgi:hypothetical protein